MVDEPLMKPGYAAVMRLISQRTGLVFDSRLHRDVELRIRRAMSARSVPDLTCYCDLLVTEASAFDALIAELTVGETYFFRESAQLDYIRSRVIPELVERRGAGRAIRAWSAGCASGEEAYSLAILLHELGLGDTAKVIGTDLSRERLKQAGAANYSRWSLRGVPEQVVQSYFRPQRVRYQLVPHIRDSVEFRHLNLAEDHYPSIVSGVWGMDLILCRNVLIYLDAKTVQEVAGRLLRSLSADGWLFLGASDPLLSDLVPCEVVVTGAGLAYRRARPRAKRAGLPPAPRLKAASSAEPLASQIPPEASEPLRREESPAEPPLDVTAAVSFYNAREYSRAADLVARLIERDGRDPALWVLWVRSLANEGKLPEAGRVCSAALERHRTVAELMYLHATLLSAAGHDAEAAAAARRALYLDRGLIVAHIALGSTLFRLGDRAGAERMLQNAERLLVALPANEIVPASDGESVARMLERIRLQIRLVKEAA